MPDGSPLCGRIRVNEGVQSLAVGAPQDVPYTCTNIASVVIDDTLVCLECAGELQCEHDANLMATWSLQAREWAGDMDHRPEIHEWLGQIADGLLRTSQNIRERGNQ